MITRSLATHWTDPEYAYEKILSVAPPIPEHLAPRPAHTTVYNFPSMKPLHFREFPSSHLLVPLRKDILHRAVIFEADAARQGTASTKWRDEVHGSNRKLRAQKGLGMARIGDRKSPVLRGGGKAFGPRPRDFSTELNRKEYDMAWRMALSYRYRRGELIVVENDAEVEADSPGLVREIFERNGWNKASVGKRCMIITRQESENLTRALHLAPTLGVVKLKEAVDVKNLLEGGRLIVEEQALIDMLYDHQTDLLPNARRPPRG
ncbi:50S ribosomal protein L4 [Saccharata proteae CBS 121410]|uniref:Large ribosomal subunit protein uL4m n=1 Tax=Saccharata proteae CBS 121410 TaxID=1314787 RepID=A0A9P4HUY4_9PEZI|nr:50S ribosomal protein L4 [Saccharata proteae CBS 121410]